MIVQHGGIKILAKNMHFTWQNGNSAGTVVQNLLDSNADINIGDKEYEVRIISNNEFVIYEMNASSGIKKLSITILNGFIRNTYSIPGDNSGNYFNIGVQRNRGLTEDKLLSFEIFNEQGSLLQKLTAVSEKMSIDTMLKLSSFNDNIYGSFEGTFYD